MAVSWDQTGLPHAFLRAAAPVFYEVSGVSLLCEKLNDLTVITNGLRIVLLLCPSKEARTIMLGGRILREMGGVAGALAAEELASLLLMTSRGQMFRGACEEAGAFCLQPVFAARRAGSGCAVLFDGLEGRDAAGGLPSRLRCVHALGERHARISATSASIRRRAAISVRRSTPSPPRRSTRRRCGRRMSTTSDIRRSWARCRTPAIR